MQRRFLNLKAGTFASITAFAFALVCAKANDAPATGDQAPVGQAQIFSAEAIKAAYIANFVRFTHWPEDTFPEKNSPFVIGVVGNRDLEDQLLRLADRLSIRERPLRVLRIRSTRDIETCHVLFFESISSVPGASDLTVKECLDAVRGRAVLTVSDSPSFIADGGMINLYREGENLRFEIAPHQAAAARLTLSSRLLALARIVPER